QRICEQVRDPAQSVRRLQRNNRAANELFDIFDGIHGVTPVDFGTSARGEKKRQSLRAQVLHVGGPTVRALFFIPSARNPRINIRQSLSLLEIEQQTCQLSHVSSFFSSWQF